MVEGNKTIRELLGSSYRIKEIYTLEPSDPLFSGLDSDLITEITPRDLKKISFLQHPKDSVALVELLEPKSPEVMDLQLVLDGIQDPGNLGTLIRLCDWFGLEQLICSEDTVDYYNPKVIQASMGSFTRVKVIYLNLEDFLARSSVQNVGTDMDGDNLYAHEFSYPMNLILGSEGKGMRESTREQLTKSIQIPRFGKQKATESLNVSMAAGIILGQLFSKKRT